MGISEGLKKK